VNPRADHSAFKLISSVPSAKVVSPYTIVLAEGSLKIASDLRP
jgi:hypothetical protein